MLISQCESRTGKGKVIAKRRGSEDPKKMRILRLRLVYAGSPSTMVLATKKNN